MREAFQLMMGQEVLDAGNWSLLAGTGRKKGIIDVAVSYEASNNPTLC